MRWKARSTATAYGQFVRLRKSHFVFEQLRNSATTYRSEVIRNARLFRISYLYLGAISPVPESQEPAP
ncbi:hypothetical protein ACMYR2_0229 [Nitrobacter sp. TKz-YC01]